MSIFLNHQKPQGPISLENGNFPVFVKTLQGRTVTVEVGCNDTIQDLKEKFFAKEGIPASQQKLVFSGKHLKDEKTVIEHGIGKDSSIHLTLGLAGGVEDSETTTSSSNQGAVVSYTERFKNCDVKDFCEKEIAKLATDYQKRNGSIDVSWAMGSLSNVGLMLQVAVIGSLSYGSAELTTKIFSSYQTLIAHTVSKTDAAMMTCISAVRKHSVLITAAERKKEAVLRRNLGGLEKYAGEMVETFSALAKETGELCDLTEKAYVQVSRDHTGESVRGRELSDRLNGMKASQEGFKKKTELLKEALKQEAEKEAALGKHVETLGYVQLGLNAAKELARCAASAANPASQVGEVSRGLQAVANGLSGESVQIQQRIQSLEAEMEKKVQARQADERKLQRLSSTSEASSAPEGSLNQATSEKSAEEKKGDQKKEIEELELSIKQQKENISNLEKQIDDQKKLLDGSTAREKEAQQTASNIVESAERREQACAKYRRELQDALIESSSSSAELVQKIADAKDDKNSLEKALLSLELSMNNLIRVKALFENIGIFWEVLSSRCKFLYDSTSNIEDCFDMDDAEKFIEGVELSAQSWIAMTKINMMGNEVIRRVNKELSISTYEIPTDTQGKERLTQRCLAAIELDKQKLKGSPEAITE